jgi:hypothetical protein
MGCVNCLTLLPLSGGGLSAKRGVTCAAERSLPASCGPAASGAARRPPAKVPRNVRRFNVALWLAALSRRDGAGRPTGRTYTSGASVWTTILDLDLQSRLPASHESVTADGDGRRPCAVALPGLSRLSRSAAA